MYFYNKYKANSNFLLKIVAFVGSLHNCENCKNHAYMGHVQNPPDRSQPNIICEPLTN